MIDFFEIDIVLLWKKYRLGKGLEWRLIAIHDKSYEMIPKPFRKHISQIESH